MEDKDFKRSRFFNILVVGENPMEIVKKYDKNNEVERYVKFKYRDAGKLHKNAIKVIGNLLENVDKIGLTEFVVDGLKEKKTQLERMSDFEYYQQLTSGLFYDENGDALSDENPDGKYDTIKIGKNIAVPFTTKDGEETYSALKKDIDWSYIHKRKEAMETYAAAWELCVDKREPETPEETTISNAMADKERYFESFDSKEDYVDYNSSFWQYAIVDENGWNSVDGKDSKEWVKNFMSDFIEPLDGNTKLTIMECSVK